MARRAGRTPRRGPVRESCIVSRSAPRRSVESNTVSAWAKLPIVATSTAVRASEVTATPSTLTTLVVAQGRLVDVAVRTDPAATPIGRGHVHATGGPATGLEVDGPPQLRCD